MQTHKAQQTQTHRHTEKRYTDTLRHTVTQVQLFEGVAAVTYDQSFAAETFAITAICNRQRRLTRRLARNGFCD